MNIFHKHNIGAHKLSARQIFSDPILLTAFGFGSGLTKKAPGTMGTLVAVPLYLIIVYWGQVALAIITVMVIIVGVTICDRAAKN